MRKHYFIFAVFCFMALVCYGACQGDNMNNRANQLASALGLDRYISPKVNMRNLKVKAQYAIRGYDIEFGAPKKTNFEEPKLFQVKDAMNKVVAYGRIIACDTFEQAKTKLLNDMVTNSLPMDAVIGLYEVRDNIVSGLCVIKKRDNNNKTGLAMNPAVIYFIVGSSVVSLSAPSSDQDVCPLARDIERILNTE